MTIPTNSLDKPKNRMAYFRLGLKQNWQQLVLYTILLVLACVVPAYFEIMDVLDRYGESLSYHGDSILRDMGMLFVVFSCIIGVFAGVLANGYVNNKRSVHCYHSLPLTRETLFMEEGLVQCVYYLMAAALVGIINFASVATQLGFSPDGVRVGTCLALTGITGYLVVFTLFQMAAGITGTGVFRFIVSGIISFLPVLLYLLFYIGISDGMSNLRAEQYINENMVRFLCPAYNIFWIMIHVYEAEGGYIFDIFTLLLTSIVYYSAALFLHHHRKSERSGESVVWKKVVTIVKYPVIFACSAGMGMFFRLVTGSDMTWMVFGAVCGLMISFMLMNVLIGRSVKALFKGIGGLGITAFVVAVYIAVFPFDIMGLNHFMYDMGNVRSLRMEYDAMDLTLIDTEDIKKIMPYLQAITETDGRIQNYSEAYYAHSEREVGDSAGEGASVLEQYYGDYKYNVLDEKYGVSANKLYIWQSGKLSEELQSSVDVPVEESEYGVAIQEYDYLGHRAADYNVYFDYDVIPKVGMPLYRTGRVNNLSEHNGIWDVLAETKAYKEHYASLAEIHVEDIYSLHVNVLQEEIPMLYANGPRKNLQYLDCIGDLLKAASQYDMAYRDTPVIGHMEIYIQKTDKRYVIPLYAGMTEFWKTFKTFWLEEIPAITAMDKDFLVSMPSGFESYWQLLQTGYALYETEEDIMSWVAKHYDHMIIIEADTGRYMVVDQAQKAEVLTAAAMRDDCGDARVDRSYLVAAIIIDTENIRFDGDAYKNRDTWFWVRSGDTPAFVKEAFEK